MYIQTVYLPVENIKYIEEWLDYHTNIIGIEHFFLYDNTGAHPEPYSHNTSIQTNGMNKHGISFNQEYEDVIRAEKEIFKKYPVTKVIWQPMENNKIVYGQMDAAFHFAKYMKTGLCAFIDIDEFIVKGNSDFEEGRLLQKRMKSRFYYDKVSECNEVLNIQHQDWSPKVILNLETLVNYNGEWPDVIHFYTESFKHLKILDSYINHYSHSKRSHDLMLREVIDFIRNHRGHLDFNPEIKEFEESFIFEDQSHIFKNRKDKV